LKKKIEYFFKLYFINEKKNYRLNLSILLSLGKENNNDFLSSGEWRGKELNLEKNAKHSDVDYEYSISVEIIILIICKYNLERLYPKKVRVLCHMLSYYLVFFVCRVESQTVWEYSLKMSGKLLIKLNMDRRPIVNKLWTKDEKYFEERVKECVKLLWFANWK
jgi:hypothetical protein